MFMRLQLSANWLLEFGNAKSNTAHTAELPLLWPLKRKVGGCFLSGGMLPLPEPAEWHTATERHSGHSSDCQPLSNAVLVLCYRMFFQVAECCHYLSQQSGTRPQKDSLVTLLTGSRSLLSPSANNGFSPLGIANTAGK
ncbi:hypothetical protein J6590_106236 [Homalodisca vitripennis]|nr:hypothetical protein J6590_106236 [Homalodisca vitripennis]